MTQEQIFASRLEAVRKTAKEQGNCISEDQIREAFADMNFDDEQFQMVFEYLKNQKIGIGEPVNPDDYLTSEEISYLDSYLESLSMLESYSEGVKEAITLSAMAGDSDAKSKLIGSITGLSLSKKSIVTRLPTAEAVWSIRPQGLPKNTFSAY